MEIGGKKRKFIIVLGMGVILIILGFTIPKLVWDIQSRDDILHKKIAQIGVPKNWEKEEKRNSDTTGRPGIDTNQYYLVRTYNVSSLSLNYDELKDTIDKIMRRAGFSQDPCEGGVCGYGGAKEDFLDAYYTQTIDRRESKEGDKCILYGEVSINPTWEYSPNREQQREETQQNPPKEVYFELIVDRDCYE